MYSQWYYSLSNSSIFVDLEWPSRSFTDYKPFQTRFLVPMCCSWKDFNTAPRGSSAAADLLLSKMCYSEFTRWQQKVLTVLSEVEPLSHSNNLLTSQNVLPEWRINFIIRPRRNTTYVDAAYYRPSSVVCRSVCLSVWTSVCRSVTVVSPAKTAEPIEMPFGLRTRVSRWNHVLDLSMGTGNFEEGRGVPLQNIGTFCGHLCKYGWTNRDAVWVDVDSGGPKKACIWWAQIPHAKRQLLGERTCPGMSDDILSWAVRKRLNRSICQQHNQSLARYTTVFCDDVMHVS